MNRRAAKAASWRAGAIAGLLLAACSSTPPAASPTPTPSASPGSSSVPTSSAAAPGPTSSVSAAPSASPAAISPSPVTTASPPPATASAAPVGEGLSIEWINPVGSSGLEALSDISGYAQHDSRYVIVGQMDVLGTGADAETVSQPAIWWSDNATQWQRAQLPEGVAQNDSPISAVTAGGPGFVAVGGNGSLWSTDGVQWSKGTGIGLDNLGNAAIGGTADGVVIVGKTFDPDKTFALESTDGKTWAAADQTAQLLAGADVTFVQDDGLTALVRKPHEDSGQTTFYSVPSLATWNEQGTVDDWITAAAFGPRGWVGLGSYAWVSRDGTTWTRAPATPIVRRGTATAVIADTSGFVVSETVYPPGCAIEESQITGSTWTSVDGLAWEKMKPAWKGRWQNALFVIGRTLVGVGQSHDGTGGNLPFGFVRTADLPLVAGAAATPPPTPSPSPTPQEGCGG